MNHLKFMLAGNATFTAQSRFTGTRFTFRVRQKKDTPTTHFVSVMRGSDNENSYEFVGVIWNGKDYRHGGTSRILKNEKAAVAARWVCQRILDGKDLPDCDFHHAGRCGRCGRKLTVPESILSGFGPECASLV